MWVLQGENNGKRTYISSVTGTEIKTSVIYTDGGGRKWYGFDDLMQIPYGRKLASNTMSQMYGAGLSAGDIQNYAASMKTILRSNDADKYEKAFAQVLALESIAENNLTPLKQELGLCTIYILAEDERIDYYDSNIAAEKMAQWGLDSDAIVFFLEWFTNGMIYYKALYSQVSETASVVEETKLKLTSIGDLLK